MGGPDLNPLPNDVSDARPERGARVPVAIINLTFTMLPIHLSLLYFGPVEMNTFDFKTSKSCFVFFFVSIY